MKLPETPLELAIGYMTWAKTNINNNLDFVPEDKLDWKPAPEAKSALEIINHVGGTLSMVTSSLKGEAKPELPTATNRDEAKALLTQVIDTHISAAKALQPTDMEKPIELPFGTFPAGFVAGLPVVELVNHHGQITYIQTLLGDSESHMIMG